MRSRRLPGKSLADLSGKPLLSWVVARLRLLPSVDDVVVLTSDAVADDTIARWCDGNDVAWWRGSEEDVLGRYADALAEFDADHIVRATADNPFVDPFAGEELVLAHLAGNADYSSNKSEVGSCLPDGLGLEVFSASCLRHVARVATRPDHREHINEYVLANAAEFRVYYDVAAGGPGDWSEVRLTVDNPADLALARRIISSPMFSPEVDLDTLLLIRGESVH